MQTPLLDQVKSPADLREIARNQLRQLADELRAETISAVQSTGGHLGAGLGVVELTVALHYVFDTPARRASSGTSATRPIRTRSSPAGATASARCAKGRASPVSPSAPRASTIRSAPRTPPPRSAPRSASAVARDQRGDDSHVIAVIGDGSMSAGMAYEAMNNAARDHQAAHRHPQRQRHVDRASGRRHVFVSRRASRPRKPTAASARRRRPSPSICRSPSTTSPRRPKNTPARMVTGGTFFEELGFHYLGPVRRPRSRHAGADPARTPRNSPIARC